MAEHGCSAMSMRQLATACGLNVAAIYHYFESKDALLAAVIEERRYANRIAESLDVDRGLPLIERVSQIFCLIWQGANEEGDVFRLLLGECMRGEPAVMDVTGQVFTVFRDGIQAWIADIAPELQHPAEVADLMVGQLFACFVRHQIWPDLDPVVIGKSAAQALALAVSAGSIDTLGVGSDS